MVIIQPALNLYHPALFPERRLASHWYSPHLANLATKGNIYIKISKTQPGGNSLIDQMRERKRGRGEGRGRERKIGHWKKGRSLQHCLLPRKMSWWGQLSDHMRTPKGTSYLLFFGVSYAFTEESSSELLVDFDFVGRERIEKNIYI